MRLMGSQGPTLSSYEQRRLWSDWADAQADLSLRWAHTHFVGFVMSRLIEVCWQQLFNLLVAPYFVDTVSFLNNNDNEPPHDKTNKMVCAPSEDSEQPVRIIKT